MGCGATDRKAKTLPCPFRLSPRKVESIYSVTPRGSCVSHTKTNGLEDSVLIIQLDGTMSIKTPCSL